MSLRTSFLQGGKLLLLLIVFFAVKSYGQQVRSVASFDRSWRFHLGDVNNGSDPSLADNNWRQLNLPHDWSVEGQFSKDNPAGFSGG